MRYEAWQDAKKDSEKPTYYNHSNDFIAVKNVPQGLHVITRYCAFKSNSQGILQHGSNVTLLQGNYVSKKA